jgi:hypothetical protein
MRNLAGVLRQPGARASIALGVILAIVVAAAFVVLRAATASPSAPAATATPSPPNAAERTVAAFYTAVSHQNYATAYTLLASQQQQRLSLAAFEQITKQLDQSEGPVTSFHELRYDRDTNDPHQATIQEQVSRTHEPNYVVGLQMIEEANGSWLILDENRTI